MTASIVTLTLNPALDVTTEIDAMVPGRKLRCGEVRTEPGGGGINVSRAIAELGGTSHAFLVLAGASGVQYGALLARSGLTFTSWPGTGETRTSLTVMESRTGAHYRFVFPGPHQPSDAGQALFSAILATLDPATRFVVASGTLLPGLEIDFYRRLADHCRARGQALILDTSGPALAAALRGRPHMIKLNHLEARELAGGPQLGETGAIELGRLLRERHQIEVVIITLGAEGAVLVAQDEAVHIRPPLVGVKSPVGAGDSFVAAFVLKRAAGAPLADACRYGVAAAASAVTTEASRLCRKHQTDTLYARMIADSA